jgi:hypothetical protein
VAVQLRQFPMKALMRSDKFGTEPYERKFDTMETSRIDPFNNNLQVTSTAERPYFFVIQLFALKMRLQSSDFYCIRRNKAWFSVIDVIPREFLKGSII